MEPVSGHDARRGAPGEKGASVGARRRRIGSERLVGRGRRRVAVLGRGLAIGLAAGVGGPLYATSLVGAAPVSPASSAQSGVQLVIENVSTPAGAEPAFVGPNGVGAPVLVDLVAGTTTAITVVNKTGMPHTFTSAALGLAVTIPPGPATVHFSVDPKRSGIVAWQCDIPCGAWVMSHAGYMLGQVDVKAAGTAPTRRAHVPAGPAGAPRGTPTLGLTAQPIPGKGSAVTLVARLAGPAGASRTAKPASLGGVKVYFSLHLTEFAEAPLLALGSATTDAKGEAVFTYEPTWTGRQDLVASATSATGTMLTAATSTVTARASRPLARSTEAARPDGTIGQVVVGVLLSILVLLWIVLFSVVVRVHRGVAPSPM